MHQIINENLIIHISHTDIRFDSRILKELNSLQMIKDKTINALGIEDRINKNKKYNSNIIKIETIHLKSKSLLFLPRAFLYFLNFIEANIIFTFKILILKPKIIHCHDTFLLPSAALINLILGSTLFYDAHELESNKNGQSYILSKITLFIEKVCWSRISLLISVSKSIICWYENHLGRKRSEVILNSPEISNYKNNLNNNKNYLREKYKIPEKAKIFIYVGLLSEGRNIKTFLEIFSEREIKDHLVIIGEGTLSKLVKRFSKKNKNIHLHKSVPHYDLVSLLKESDVGLCLIENVSLSDYYCLPNKLFEYMFAGLYILASDFPEINLLSREFDSIRLCKSDKEIIKSEIKNLISQKIKKYNNEYQSLSWKYQTEKLYSAYKNFID